MENPNELEENMQVLKAEMLILKDLRYAGDRQLQERMQDVKGKAGEVENLRQELRKLKTEALREFFEDQFGAVEEAVVMRSQEADQVCSRGFGFVTFKNKESAVAAVQVHYSNFWGRKVEIKGASYFMDERDPFIDSSIIISERSLLGTQNENGALEVENHIICGREKLKETDEYRRASEEVWASRQPQLQIQAEEAQKLRKRKRAETQRLLDMERRQKERVEEMREAQKKNVETSNLKEQFRAEIRKELGLLELINTDMISLLRALGIKVGSGFSPTSHEVNAAYKRALLKFHPDRASKTDIRQQVEAEEKFKLISRLKDKITNLTNSKSQYF